ncbi:MAG: DUF1015 domain-containing protein [Dorea sp.]|nr:DUF1015 domain-containing protein [Dorea sp.]
MKSCFQPAEILLPEHTIEKSKWAVIACDQFTSQQDYWSEVERYVGSACSTLHIIFPEIYLGNDSDRTQRIQKIQNNMEIYLKERTLETTVSSGYILVERVTKSGVRIGLVGQIDLEQYDFDPRHKALVRATEGTVLSRIPPRVAIRKDAKIEIPHVMLLFDDPEKQILEPLYERRGELKMLYDTELMLDGGHVRGFAVEHGEAEAVTAEFERMQTESDGFLFAVGDGNHSLAAAKACWEAVKQGLSPDAAAVHPARYALVEVVNLHSPALCFEPIHRLLLHTELSGLMEYFQKKLNGQGMDMEDGEEIIFSQGERMTGIRIRGRGERLPVEILQGFLDDYLMENPEVQIDYIHGRESLEELEKETGGCGIYLQSIDKRMLFPAIRAGGVLPRKTFSIGEAREKRYYMECKKLWEN